MEYNFDDYLDRSDSDAEKLMLRKQLYGTEDVTPLWVADMDLRSPQVIIDALKSRLDHPLLGYTGVSASTLNSIQWWMEVRHNVELEPRDILLAPSVVASISAAIETFCDDRKGVALFSPVYGPFHSYPKKHQRSATSISLDIVDGRYEINFEKVERIFKKEKIGLFLLCNPHNPGGRVWSREELVRLVELCGKYHIFLFSDEIHSDLVFKGVEHTSVLSIPQTERLAGVAHSIGKTFNCSGLNGSFVLIKDKRIRTAFQRSLQKFHTDEINLMAKVAIESGFSPAGEEYLRQLIPYIESNAKEVCERINSSSAPITAMVPESTFLVWINFNRTGLLHEEILRKLVDEAKVGLTGGKFFGREGDRWFRINVAHPKERLMEIVNAIISVFSE